MKTDLTKLFCFYIVIIFLTLLSNGKASYAKINIFIDSLAISENFLYIGELGGGFRVFDITNKIVSAKSSIEDCNSKVIVNDGHRIIAITSLSGRIFEISPKGKTKFIGKLSGRFRGYDSDYYYCSRYVYAKPYNYWENFRLNKKFENLQKAHFPNHPNLFIQDQTEDIQNYYFFCSTRERHQETNYKEFALVIKNKSTGNMNFFKFNTDQNFSFPKITNDQKSVWLLLISNTTSDKNRIIHYSKQNKSLDYTPYWGVRSMVKNLKWNGLPQKTYALHYSDYVFPMKHDVVLQKHEIAAEILLLKYDKNITPRMDGLWSPNKQRWREQNFFPIPAHIKHVLTDYYAYHSYCTYGKNNWFVGITKSKLDDGSLYHIIKVPFELKEKEVYAIKPTIFQKLSHILSIIIDIPMAILIMIFGT